MRRLDLGIGAPGETSPCPEDLDQFTSLRLAKLRYFNQYRLVFRP
jgi:hypothetical protein